jgi:hypothetical protein
MKKVFSIIFLLIICNCKAQQLTFKQLLQLSSCSNFTQSSDYLKSNNYVLNDSIVKGKLSNYIWHKGKANTESNDSLKTATWMQITTLFNVITVTTGTSINSEALAFINELAAEGFTFLSTTATDKTATTKFKNNSFKNIQVEQTSSMQTTNGKTSIYWYSFKIVQIM